MAASQADEIAAQRKRVAQLESDLDVPGLRHRFEELQQLAAAPDLWDDTDRARRVTTEMSWAETRLGRFDELVGRLDDLEVLDQLAVEEDDASSASEVATGLEWVRWELDRVEIATLLSGEHDASDAIVSVHAGEGGVDAMDWAQMLQRMYLRWAETRGFESQIYDQSYGEEAGLKSTTFEVRGPDAYGFLSTEHGVHRLVRISPFDAQSRRQTSFALVDVVPVMPDVDEEVEVADEDIRVDVYRSSGPGGQSVNTTDSAVRITHEPTGIVVSCQNEKSQHQNKAVAMRVLKAKLAERERQRRQEEIDELRGAPKNVGFGSQIRSYVLHPYQMVKDHRSDVEIGSPEKVLDGDLDLLIETELRRRVREVDRDD